MSVEPRVRTFATRLELERALAERLRAELSAAEPSALMLSGGNTPLPAYRALAIDPPTPAPGLHLLYSDERYVPRTSDASNFHRSRELLEALRLPAEQVISVCTDLPLEQAAQDYERNLRALLRKGTTLQFGLLGLGADGHTASLFSAEDLNRARARLAIAVHRPDGRDAVTVTPDLLAQFATLLIVAAGRDKRDALALLLGHDAKQVAVRAIAECRSVEVWVDREATRDV
jgi:6-phosphogluconolactonase